MADRETGLVFVLDGTDYPAPDLDSFDMGERRVMYDLAGIIEEDFVRDDSETEEDHQDRVKKLMRHPGFMEALMHVAYARGNPNVKRAKVAELIERTNYFEAIAKWADATADAENPPVLESTNEPDNPSPTENDGSNTNSGPASPESSGQQDATPGSTGTTESDTSPTSARSLQAV